MPFTRTQQKDIAGMNGDGAVNGAMQAFATNDEGNFKEVVLMQRRVALVHWAIDVDGRANSWKQLLAAQKFRSGNHGFV